jgi:hypothetical protein
MRTTIDLPLDLHNAITSIASHARKSMNQVVAELLHRALAGPEVPLSMNAGIDRQTGLPVIRSSRPVTEEDVYALEDE